MKGVILPALLVAGIGYACRPQPVELDGVDQDRPQTAAVGDAVPLLRPPSERINERVETGSPGTDDGPLEVEDEQGATQGARQLALRFRGSEPGIFHVSLGGICSCESRGESCPFNGPYAVFRADVTSGYFGSGQ